MSAIGFPITVRNAALCTKLGEQQTFDGHRSCAAIDRAEEKAVDLTAMLLGFSLLYRRAAHVVKRVGYNQYREERLGYLGPNELNEACRVLIPRELMRRIEVINF